MTLEKIILRFSFEKNIELEKARNIFQKLVDGLDKYVSLDEPYDLSIEEDEAWHFFIIDTMAYAEFCEEKYGKFLHHVPEDMGLKIVDGKVSATKMSIKKCDPCAPACNIFAD